MKYTLPAAVVCDHCGKTAGATLMVVTAGDLRRDNLVVPEGWVTEVVAPTVPPIAGRSVQVDLAASPHRVANLTGRRVQGAWCSAECRELSAGHETVRSLVVPG